MKCMLLLLATTARAVRGLVDWRNSSAGQLMLSDSYLDQPYCVQWANASVPSRWVCAITRNSFPEGSAGEHVEALYSDDAGANWVVGVRLEPSLSLTNAYSTLILTDFGRILAVYNMNLDNVTRFPSGAKVPRDDMIGHYVMRFSDDGGETWSPQRYEVPVRPTSIDASNDWKGAVRIMWNGTNLALSNAAVSS